MVYRCYSGDNNQTSYITQITGRDFDCFEFNRYDGAPGPGYNLYNCTYTGFRCKLSSMYRHNSGCSPCPIGSTTDVEPDDDTDPDSEYYSHQNSYCMVCRKGYYGLRLFDGYQSAICTCCPEDKSSVSGINNFITDCFIEQDTGLLDGSGNYDMNDRCYYSD